MSEQTNNILQLFSKLLRNPRFMMAVRRDFNRQQMQDRGGRNGARGLLYQLWEKDGLTNSEIAELLDIRPSSVTAQVKLLENEGMIERVTDENDKRVSRVFLTEKGKKAKDERHERHDSELDNLFGDLTEEEQTQLKDLLQKLLDSWSAKADEADEEFNAWKDRPFAPDFDPERMKEAVKDWQESIKNADFDPEQMKEMMKAWQHGFRDMKHQANRHHGNDNLNTRGGRGFAGQNPNGFPGFGGGARPDRKAPDNWDDF